MVAWHLALASIPQVGQLWVFFVWFNPMASLAVLRRSGNSPFAPIHGEGDHVDVGRLYFASIPRRVRFLGGGAVGIHSDTTASSCILRGAVHFSFAPIPRGGTFCVWVVLRLRSSSTMQEIHWGWVVWSLINYHLILSRPQGSCAFFPSLQSQGGGYFDLLHYSPYLTICSNWLPSSHHKVNWLSAHHIHRCIFLSWWKK